METKRDNFNMIIETQIIEIVEIPKNLICTSKQISNIYKTNIP